MNVIQAQDLSVQYGELLALDHVSIEIPEGSIYAFLGPNGAGKTTLFDLFVNLHAPRSGKALVLGTDSRDLKGSHFEKIGYVSEDQELAGWMTVRYFLDYLRPFYPGWDPDRARELTEQFGLPTDRKLRNLSRGMRMKAMLTASMAYRPALLILDEPFSGLDPLTRDELIEALLDCASETTIVLSSHDLPEIETFVTHVCYLNNGRAELSGTLSSLSRRFRQISITLNETRKWTSWPEHWIGLDTGPGLVRFVDTDFEPTRSMTQITAHFGSVRDVETEAMSLRSIFLALARRRETCSRGDRS